MINTDYLDLARQIAGGRPVLKGSGNKNHPRYFIVGSSPAPKDLILQKPFSGPNYDVIRSAMHIITGAVNAKREKENLDPIEIRLEDQYLTYFIKALHGPKEVMTEEYTRSWLPVIQREAEQVRPQNIVCLGTVARPFAGKIPAWEYVEDKGIWQRVRDFIGV